MSNQDDKEKGAFWVMLEALRNGGNVGDAIMAQEKQGQTTFTASDVLPRDMGSTTREQVEAMGFVFGEPVDDLFIACKLPAGWKKVATDHSMWSNIVDANDVVKAQVFYKAAFYDERAFVRFND